MFVCSIFICFTTRDEIGLYVANKTKMNQSWKSKKGPDWLFVQVTVGFLKADVAAV